MDRDVIQSQQISAELPAIAAVRVLEHCEHAATRADFLGDRKLKRQFAEIDGEHLLNPLAGEIALRLHIDQVA